MVEVGELMGISADAAETVCKSMNIEVLTIARNRSIRRVDLEKILGHPINQPIPSNTANTPDVVMNAEQVKKEYEQMKKFLEEREAAFNEKVEKFEPEQKQRVETANSIIQQHKDAIAQLKTRDENTKKLQEQAIKEIAEAQTIKDAQTAKELQDVEIKSTFEQNKELIPGYFDEAYELIRAFSVKAKNDWAYRVAGYFYKNGDYLRGLIADTTKSNQDEIIEICKESVDLLGRVCEELQNKYQGKFTDSLNKLSRIIDLLDESCSIIWTPMMPENKIAEPQQQCPECGSYYLKQKIIKDKVAIQCRDCGALIPIKED